MSGFRLRYRSEHALVDGEEEIGNLMTTNRRRRQGIPESNVVEVADEFPRSVREGERVAPEEPLEGGDAGRHHREPYQRQSRLSTSKSGVEEAERER